MENLNTTMILLALLGLVLHICGTILKRKKDGKKLSFKAFFTDGMNWIRIIMSAASMVILLIAADDIVGYLGVKLDDGSLALKMFAVFAGHSSHALIRYVLKVFKNRLGDVASDNSETSQ